MALPTISDFEFLAVLAQIEILQVFNNPHKLELETKSDKSLVTVADININNRVVEHFAEKFPNIRVIGEERSSEPRESEHVIMVDPIDGTSVFARGIPISAFAITLFKERVPVLALIYDPFQGRAWKAEKGRGCHLNDTRVFVSEQKEIKGSGISLNNWDGAGEQFGLDLYQVYENLVKSQAKTLIPLSVAYFGGLIADGNMEGSVLPGTIGWETGAMQLLVEEAGGKVTDIYGNPLVYDEDYATRGHIITNGLIHDQLVEIVNRRQ